MHLPRAYSCNISRITQNMRKFVRIKRERLTSLTELLCKNRKQYGTSYDVIHDVVRIRVENARTIFLIFFKFNFCISQAA